MKRAWLMPAVVGSLLLGLAAPVTAAPPGGGGGTTTGKFASKTPVAIPDGSPEDPGAPGNGLSPIDAANGLFGNITSVTVSLHISHGRTTDLDVYLYAPDLETYAHLGRNQTSSGAGLGTSCATADRTVFDAGAATGFTAGTAPFVGSYRPEGDPGFEAFVNKSAALSDGVWYLAVADVAEGYTGTIDCWSITINTSTGQSQTFDSTDSAEIGDATDPSGGSGIANSPVNVSGLAGALVNATVTIWISHPNVSDLTLRLVGPGGHNIELARNVGGTGGNFGTSCKQQTGFDDAAVPGISAGEAPFVGTFKPRQAFSLLRLLEGGDLNGTWNLRAEDGASGNVGTIMCWSLTLQTSTSITSSLQLIPKMTAPQPLAGAYDTLVLEVRNDTPDAFENVVVTSALPSSLSDFHIPSETPGCSVTGSQLTCALGTVAAGERAFGAVTAKVGKVKSGKLCVDGAATATGFNAVSAKACFTQSSYPAGDQGTGYGIGDIAHNLVLLDQHGNAVSLYSLRGKYVELSFTTVWCTPSQIEVPQDVEELKALNLSGQMPVEVTYYTVLLEQFDGDPTRKADAIDWVNAFDFDPSWPVLWNAKDLNKSAVQQQMAYSLTEGSFDEPAIPNTVFIRPDGTIFDLRVGLHDPGDTTARFLADLP